MLTWYKTLPMWCVILIGLVAGAPMLRHLAQKAREGRRYAAIGRYVAANHEAILDAIDNGGWWSVAAYDDGLTCPNGPGCDCDRCLDFAAAERSSAAYHGLRKFFPGYQSGVPWERGDECRR